MTTGYDVVELYAGLGAVSLAALGAPPPPVSRVGSKTGYATPILRALGIEPGTARRVLLVESDERLVAVLRCLAGPERQRRLVAERIALLAQVPAREAWQHARSASLAGDVVDPALWLLWAAGARGGVGGFKGGHKLRPSVDGFIPSRTSLARRVARFRLPDGARLDVVHGRAEDLAPDMAAPTAVYLDPPYADSVLLHDSRTAPCRAGRVAERWRAAGHRVVLSERARPAALDDAVWQAERIDGERRGQTRRSLTRSAEEWIFVAGGGA